jgi:2-keto-4-pentenoate hydratase
MKRNEKNRILEDLADNFLEAFYQGTFPGDRTFDIGRLSIEQAYQVQEKVSEKRINKGEKVAGYKVGCTSKAIQEQFGLREPIYAQLFEPYIFKDGSEIFWKDYVNCAIEPEIVLVTGKDLKGENLSDDELISGIKEVRPGVEIHQFKFWFSPATSQELICSGGIHLGLVIGNNKVTPDKLSFETEIFKVLMDGKRVTSGAAKEIMGGPIQSLRWLIASLSRKGTYLKAGSYVIPGSPVELVRVNKETLIRVEVEKVGSVSTYFINRN